MADRAAVAQTAQHLARVRDLRRVLQEIPAAGEVRVALEVLELELLDELLDALEAPTPP